MEYKNIIDIPQEKWTDENKLKWAEKFFTHIPFWRKGNFPFDCGIITVGHQFALSFDQVVYNTVDASQGFVVDGKIDGMQMSIYLGVDLNSNTFRFIPMDEETQNLANEFQGREAGALLLPMAIIDMVQIRALKSRNQILKVQAEAEHKAQSEEHALHQTYTPIHLSGGLTYSIQYANEDAPHKTYERHTESWPVRGHYRHYKSGKTVFVHPYIKGHGETHGRGYDII